MKNPEEWMKRALTLARSGEGLTRPNPPVGAVVVQNGQSVGEGYHSRAGGPHAEVHALEQAGRKAAGATLFVTLEPCSTFGRTPPCTARIIESGIKRVVVSVKDPNPAHAGRGLRILRRAGLEVDSGLCAEEGRELIAPFASWVVTGRPYVTLKLAITVDGKIADRKGRSKWITGPQARVAVQAMRRRADAILVGAGTVVADNPSLWPRPAKGRHPWRVVLDPELLTPASAKVYCDAHARRTVMAVSGKSNPSRLARYRQHGAETMLLPVGHQAAVRSLMTQLAKRGILHVLCEGGGHLAESLIRAGLVDEFVFFVAPKIMGGDHSIGAVRGAGWLMGELPELKRCSIREVGRDLLLRYKPKSTGTRG